MRRNRRIIFDCDEDAAALGGYRTIDTALDAIMDALLLNPYGFHLLESDWYGTRYAITKAVGDAPKLLWLFVIVDGDVIIKGVERFDDY